MAVQATALMFGAARSEVRRVFSERQRDISFHEGELVEALRRGWPNSRLHAPELHEAALKELAMRFIERAWGGGAMTPMDASDALVEIRLALADRVADPSARLDEVLG